MSHEPDPQPSAKTLQSEIDAVCDAYETAWKKGGTEPNLNDFLDNLSQATCDLAATELILLDRLLRRL